MTRVTRSEPACRRGRPQSVNDVTDKLFLISQVRNRDAVGGLFVFRKRDYSSVGAVTVNYKWVRCKHTNSYKWPDRREKSLRHFSNKKITAVATPRDLPQGSASGEGREGRGPARFRVPGFSSGYRSCVSQASGSEGLAPGSDGRS